MIKLIYKILKNFGLWVFPILLIFFSVTLNISNAELHKQSFIATKFYERLDQTLEDAVDSNQGQIKPLWLVTKTISRGLITPNWLQNVVETNINNLTNWFEGDTDTWSIFLPTSDFEEVLKRGFDTQVIQEANQNKNNIPTCSSQQAAKLAKQGFEVEDFFCLPKVVRDGDQDFTSFLDLDENSEENSKILNKLIRGDRFKNFTHQKDQKPIDQLIDTQSVWKVFWHNLNIFRDKGLWVRAKAPWFIGVTAVYLLILILLAILSKKNLTSELIRSSFVLTGSILTSCVVFIGIFGGTAYLNLSLNSLFFRDLPINKLSNLILSQVVVIGLNLVSTAILISLCLASFGFILIIAKATGIIHNRKKKNQKIKQFRPQPEITNTFDGQFQNEVLDMQEEKQPENLPDSQSFAQTDRQTEIQNIQNFSTELKSKDKIENLSQLQEEENFFNSKIENSEVDPVQLGEPIN